MMKSMSRFFVPILALVFAGCGGSEPVRFRLNMEGRDRSDVNRNQQQLLVDALTAAFGEPDAPYVFTEAGLDLEKLQLAAGKSMTTQTGPRHGLYRQHCAHCHGVSGDGLGPTAAFLNPYPRDYRKGIFKFTSTGDGAKATRADLKKTIVQGIPGTAMPSFALLPDDEVEALVEYVKYLAIRGETEILLFGIVVDEDNKELTRDNVVNDAMMPIVEMWNKADTQVVHPEPRPESIGPIDQPTKESIAKGRKLFIDTKRGQCINCHGPTGIGDGGDRIYDAWNEAKEQLIKAGKEDQIAQLFSLPIQELRPRNLHLGIYRGGRRPVDLYRRVYAGIKGAKMPAGGATPQKPTGFSSEEIWNLIDYVRSLPYDDAPKPAASSEHGGHTAHLQTN